MREQEPTDWLNMFVNQERLDVVVRWHSQSPTPKDGGMFREEYGQQVDKEA